MIFGNIKNYRACDMSSASLDKYIEILKGIPSDIENGKYELEDGAFYNVCTIAEQKPASEKVFESHKKYIDIQYVFEGTEEIEYADIDTCTVTQEYNEEKDCALHDGKGSLLILKAGDFAVFAPMDAHKPGCGNASSRKVIIKVPVK